MRITIATPKEDEIIFLRVLGTMKDKVSYSKRFSDRFPNSIFWDLVVLDESYLYTLFDLGWYYHKLKNE